MAISSRFAVMVCLACAGAMADEKPPQPIVFDDPLGKVDVGLPPMDVTFEQSQAEVAPKIIKELRLVCKDGPAAVLVSTRIRDELPKDDRVLERIEPKYKNFKAQHEEGDVLLEFRGRTVPTALWSSRFQAASTRSCFPTWWADTLGSMIRLSRSPSASST